MGMCMYVCIVSKMVSKYITVFTVGYNKAYV